MEVVENLGTEVNKYSQINEYINIFNNSVQVHLLVFKQCLSYFDSFKLSGMSKWWP